MDRAHLEFLRMTDVTARISERTTCLMETAYPEYMPAGVIVGCFKASPPTWKRCFKQTKRLMKCNVSLPRMEIGEVVVWI